MREKKTENTFNNKITNLFFLFLNNKLAKYVVDQSILHFVFLFFIENNMILRNENDKFYVCVSNDLFFYQDFENKME